jgi:hypothetical protein
MAQRRIRTAFAFDSHFATAGFRMVADFRAVIASLPAQQQSPIE